MTVHVLVLNVHQLIEYSHHTTDIGVPLLIHCILAVLDVTRLDTALHVKVVNVKGSGEVSLSSPNANILIENVLILQYHPEVLARNFS